MGLKNNILLFVSVWFVSSALFAQPIQINGVPRDTSYTAYSSYVKEKKNFPFIQLVDTNLPKGIITFEGIAYKNISVGRSLHLSIYRPAGTMVLPLVLMIHGGGWNSGTPDMQKALAINLANKGYVTATVEYRLSPEALYPAAVDDLVDALKWLGKNADNYHIDKDKIAVSGCSAGGQLAALIGTKNNEKQIKAIINIDGISTFIDQSTIERAQKARDSKTKMPVDAQWLGGTWNERQDIWKDASAPYWVNEHSAPICFINSSIPRFHNGRDVHVKLLDSLGIYSEIHTFNDTPHTFWLFHPWHLSTVRYAANFLNNIFSTSKELVDTQNYDIVVAKDGSGDFLTVQAAVNAVPDFRKKQTRILIKNGFYREKIIIPETKDSLILVGEDVYKTILSFNNFASKSTGFGDNLGTSGSASTYICSPNFTAENITFENLAGPVGQAVAVIVRSDKARFINCRFLGFQDTLYTHKADSRQYYKNCFIEGTVDFIFGSSTAYFDECEIFCKASGYVTAASTPQNNNYGYVFYKCNIHGEKSHSFYLGRPWRPYAHVAFIDCKISDVIKKEGWNNWGKTDNEKTATFVEYNSSGKGRDLQNKRVRWARRLHTNEVSKYDRNQVLGDDFDFN